MSKVVCIGCGEQAYIVCCSDLPLIETVCKACILQFSFKGKEKCQSCHKSIIHKIAKMKSDITRQINSQENERNKEPLCIFPEKKPQLFSGSNDQTDQLKRNNSGFANFPEGFMRKTHNNPKPRNDSPPKFNPYAALMKPKAQNNPFSFKFDGFNSEGIRDAINYSNEVLNIPPDYDAIIQKERLKIGNASFAQPGEPQESREDYFDRASEPSDLSSLQHGN